MWNRIRRFEDRIYLYSILFAAAFWVAHVVSLPVEITYDGLGYVDLSDVLGSSRFPHDWNVTRTPLLPLFLKIAFLVFGRQPLAAILVPAGVALAGIVLLAASVRRLGGPLAGAGTALLVSLFPTLVAYQHCVLTETGSFFFVSLTLYIATWTPRRLWMRTAALALALSAGFYWRQNILALAPVFAVLHALSERHRLSAALGEIRRTRRFVGALGAWPVAAHLLAIVVIPFLLSRPWGAYTDERGLRDTTLRQGILRQALLPPEHPFVGEYRDDYYRAIRSSFYKRNFISGMRWNLMSELAAKIWARPTPQPVPQFFFELARQNPGRYLNALGRTLVFFAGVNGVESDNRIFRDEVLSETLHGSKISTGPEPLRSNIQRDFQQRTTPSLVMKFLRALIPAYEPLLILASALTVLGLLAAVWLRDLRLMAFTAIPCAYALSYAVFLVSLDRFMVPVYPLALANVILVPLAIYRRFARPAKTMAAAAAASAPVHAAAAPASCPPAAAPPAPVSKTSEAGPASVPVRPPRLAQPGEARLWIPAAILLLLPAHMILALFGLYNRIPWGDYVNLFCATELYNGLTWTKLIAFSNEHRIAFTRLVVFFDYAVLHGDNIVPFVAGALLALVPAAACVLALRYFAPDVLSRWQALVTGALLAAIYFNGNQAVTLANAIMLQHYFVDAFAIVAAWALSFLLFGGRRQAYAAGAGFLLAAVCGSFSSANGILIAPAAAAAAALVIVLSGWKALLRRWKPLLFLVFASVAIAAGYIIPYVSQGRLPGQSGGPSGLLARAHFILLFIGAPFWRETSWPLDYHSPLWLVTAASLAFAALAAWVLLLMLRRRASWGRFEVFHLTVMCFVLATAVAGSSFRADSGVAQAFNKRYAATALLFWLSTLSLLIFHRPGLLFGGRRLWLRPTAISAAIVGVLLPLHLSEIHTWMWWTDRITETAAMVGSGMFDYVRVKRLYYDDAEGYQLMGIFRGQQVYFPKEYPLPPYPLKSRYEVRGRVRAELRGTPQFLDEYPGRSGYIIIGSMPPGAAPSGKLIITDSHDTVVGYGHISEVAERWRPFAKPTSWYAAFRNPNGSPAVKVYSVRSRGAMELARIAVPPLATGSLPRPSGCLIAGINDMVLETMNGVAQPITGAVVDIHAAEPLRLKGWAADRSKGLPALGVKAYVDGKPYDVPYGYSSPDIAGYFKNPAYANVGMRVELPTESLAKGKHNLFFRISTRGEPGCRQSGIYLFTVR